MKIIKQLLSVFLCGLTIVLLSSCSCGTNKPHVHELVDDDEILATCTNNGLTKGKHCLTCDYKEGKEIIPALGHDIVIDDIIYPRCYREGLTEGSHCSRCNEIIVKQEVIDAVDHYFLSDTKDNFFNALCMYGCGTFGIEHSHLHDNAFKLTFNTDEGCYFSYMEEAINETIEYLNNLEKYDESKHFFVKDSQLLNECNDFISNYDIKIDNIYFYLENQVKLERFYRQNFPLDDNEIYYNDIENAYNFIYNSVNNIYILIYESCLKDYYYRTENGFTDEYLSNLYENLYGVEDSIDETLDNLNKRIDELMNEYYNLDYGQFYGNKLNELYAEYIHTLNQKTKLEYGSCDADFNAYHALYMDYYNRQYSPKDAEVLRSYVLKYLRDVQTITFEVSENNNKKVYEEPENDYLNTLNRIQKNNVFIDAGLLSLIGNYFKTLNNATNNTPATIDFYYSLNEMLKNHDYFENAITKAAFTSKIQGIPIICFPNNFSDSRIFVHEAGHYVNDIYNPNVNINLDYDELLSNCNELLFYIYLSTESNVVGDILLSQYINNLFVSLLLYTIVDEFEYELFKADASGNPISPDDYNEFYNSILKKYNMHDWEGSSGFQNSNQWRSYTLNGTGYPISYVCGYISSIEIYIDSIEKGYNGVKDEYLKLITYTDEIEYNDYFSLLDYLNLTNILDEKLYVKILSFFSSQYN